MAIGTEAGVKYELAVKPEDLVNYVPSNSFNGRVLDPKNIASLVDPNFKKKGFALVELANEELKKAGYEKALTLVEGLQKFRSPFYGASRLLVAGISLDLSAKRNREGELIPKSKFKVAGTLEDFNKGTELYAAIDRKLQVAVSNVMAGTHNFVILREGENLEDVARQYVLEYAYHYLNPLEAKK